MAKEIIESLTKEDLITFLNECISRRDVFRRLNLSPSGVNSTRLCKQYEKYGLIEYYKNRPKRKLPSTPLNNITKEELSSLVNECSSKKQILEKLGYNTLSGASYKMLDKKLKEYSLTITTYYGHKSTNKCTKDELFIENCKHDRVTVRKYIIDNNILDSNKCSICGITEWNGKTISMNLDHINGINNDNRIQNLRFICPNCDRQLDTYGSKNRKNKLN